MLLLSIFGLQAFFVFPAEEAAFLSRSRGGAGALPPSSGYGAAHRNLDAYLAHAADGAGAQWFDSVAARASYDPASRPSIAIAGSEHFNTVGKKQSAFAARGAVGAGRVRSTSVGRFSGASVDEVTGNGFNGNNRISGLALPAAGGAGDIPDSWFGRVRDEKHVSNIRGVRKPDERAQVRGAVRLAEEPKVLVSKHNAVRQVAPLSRNAEQQIIDWAEPRLKPGYVSPEPPPTPENWELVDGAGEQSPPPPPTPEDDAPPAIVDAVPQPSQAQWVVPRHLQRFVKKPQG